jgi:hypothetical protein
LNISKPQNPKISIEEKKWVINIEKYVENKLHIKIFGIKNIN